MKITLPHEAQYVIKALERKGFSAFVVGGCVRDSLLGKRPYDWDITTSASPDEVATALGNVKVIATGIKHGTVTAIIDTTPIEVTTYRVDGDYSDGRRPDNVAFAASIDEDLARRDFTMNAIAYSPTAGLVDLFGGAADTQNGVIRCVGEAAARFNEDGLRIMRALRFAAVLGFSIEPSTKNALLLRKKNLRNVSAERIKSELEKLLVSDNPKPVLHEFSEVFAEIIPELAPTIGFNQQTKYHHHDVFEHTIDAVANIENDIVLRLTMLLHDIAKPHTFTQTNGVGHFYGHAKVSAEVAQRVLTRLTFETRVKNEVVQLILHHCDALEPDARLIKRRLNKLGEPTLRRLIKVNRADILAQSPEFRPRLLSLDEVERVLQKIIDEQEAFSIKSLSINGDDLISLGFSKGKNIGIALDALLQEVIDGTLQNDHDKLFERAKQLLQKM